ncbi:MAG: FlgD immunoglobulin-like domain containing protein [Calditrichia bacterium]
MTIRLIWFIAICVLLTSSMDAQSKKLKRSGLNMGFQTHTSGQTKLRSVVGEVLVGRGISGDKAIKSGFDPFPNPAIIDAGAIFIVQNDTPSVGSKPIIFFETPTDFIPQTLQVFYRKGGERQFTAGAVTPTSAGFLPDIPSSIVTERGVEYYLLFTAGNLQATFPSRDPEDNPAILRVAVNRKVTPQPLAERTHRMISVPFTAGGTSMFNQLVDDYGDYNAYSWRLFRYEAGAYVEHPGLNQPLRPGEAYWLVTAEGSGFDYESGLSSNTSEPLQIQLQPGWNQISNPWAFPVAWQSVQAAQLPDGPVFYDGQQYVPEQAILEPYEGYWLYNPATNATLISIPPLEAVSGVDKTPVFVINPDKEYLLRLEAGNGELQDSYNFVGLMEAASDGLDKLDIYEPPDVGDYIQLSIAEDSTRYAANLKPVASAGQVWELDLRSNTASGNVQLHLNEEGQLPSNYKRYVMDVERRFTYGDGDDLAIAMAGKTTRKLRIILGDEDFAAANSDGIPLVPLEFALDQNYPNPFNPETTIRYQLKQISTVTLDIYNVLGQRVRSLVDGKVDTGAHAVVWDGRSDSGVSVASGVYIYRLKAGEYVNARKMVLVR